MEETESAAADGGGDERERLAREIEAVDVRLRFLTLGGHDDGRPSAYRDELLTRRAQAERSLAELGNP